jgi:hypothetical protein
MTDCVGKFGGIAPIYNLWRHRHLERLTRLRRHKPRGARAERAESLRRLFKQAMRPAEEQGERAAHEKFKRGLREMTLEQRLRSAGSLTDSEQAELEELRPTVA